MGRTNTLDLIGRQDWLQPVEDKLQKTLTTAFESGGPAGQKVKNFLHGTWLGTPLHPVLTDIPIGSWTAAIVLDALEAITDRREFAAGADAAIGIGLAGAVGAAVTGLTDWQSIDGRARRIGVVHGLMNAVALGLFTTSLVLRKRDSRRSGLGFSLLGFAVASASAHLGGDLVYSEKIGVNHTAGAALPEEFTRVLPEAELGEGQMKRVEVNGTTVLLARRGGRISAIAETCSHLGGPLSEGEMIDGTVKCPWHGSRFALEDGRVIDGPSTHPQPCFEVRVTDGEIEIGVARR